MATYETASSTTEAPATSKMAISEMLDGYAGHEHA
jgi:hypothetical protein